MLKTFELIIEGQVQRVGFRNFVSRIAFELNIKGEIQNISGERVRLIVQGEQENLSEFIKRIWVTEWPIDVWNISKKELKSVQQFERFKIIRGKIQEEISERMDEAAFFLQKLNKDLNSNFDKLFNETHEHRKVTEKFRNENNNQFNNFFGKMDRQEKIAEEHKEITKNFRKESNENFMKLFEESVEHKNITETFRNDSNKNFDKMDFKYGKISEQLEAANKKLGKLDKLNSIESGIDKVKDSLEDMKGSMQRIEKKIIVFLLL